MTHLWRSSASGGLQIVFGGRGEQLWGLSLLVCASELESVPVSVRVVSLIIVVFTASGVIRSAVSPAVSPAFWRDPFRLSGCPALFRLFPAFLRSGVLSVPAVGGMFLCILFRLVIITHTPLRCGYAVNYTMPVCLAVCGASVASVGLSVAVVCGQILSGCERGKAKRKKARFRTCLFEYCMRFCCPAVRLSGCQAVSSARI